MREGWEYKKLGEVGSFLRGSGILKSDFVDKGCPCIHYGQIHTKFGVSVDYHLSEISEKLFSKSKIANPGDIVLAITSEDVEGSCKCIAWLGNYDVAVGAHAAIFKHQQNPKYLSYCFRSKDFGLQKAKYAHGFKVVEIKPSEIAEISIPLPPLSTQQQIVAELDLLSHIIEQKRQQLKEYDALAESIFYDMFGDPVENPKGWEVKKIGEIASLFIGLTYKPSDVTDDGTGTIVLRSSNIQDNSLCYDDIVRVKTSIKDKLWVKEGDILMCSRNGSFRLVGKTAEIKNIPEPMTFGAFMTIIRSDINNYLLWYFKIPAFRIQLSGAKTTTVNQITVNMLSGINLPLPPSDLIDSFAAKIESIEKQKQLVKDSLKETETLFQSRMDYWFNA